MTDGDQGRNQTNSSQAASKVQLEYHGGDLGAILPFLLFIAGVITLALLGAPAEKTFWPVLLAGLFLGVLLCRDRRLYCETVIAGMSQPLVMLMVMAWMLASCIGVLMRDTGFIEALIWLVGLFELGSSSFSAVSFLLCCAVSLSTGTSIGTILIAGPLLYPVGAAIGSDGALLAGAILAGATFGDSISPISDTTIASALTQKADIGGTVRSRLKYVVPAAIAALLVYVGLGLGGADPAEDMVGGLVGDPRGLPMVLAPALTLVLLLARRHLVHGLLAGLAAGVLLGWGWGLLPAKQILSLDPANFTANSLIIEGIDRALGISVFTILLLGLVSGVRGAGLLDRVVGLSQRLSKSPGSAETWIAAATSLVVMLTTHSIVAILTVGEFARLTGRRFGIHRYRRANILDLTVVTFPFLLPYCIPVILAAGITRTASQSTVGPLEVGMNNYYSWAVLVVLVFALASGYGRRFAPDRS